MSEKLIRRNIVICMVILAVCLIPLILLPFCGDDTANIVGSSVYDLSDYFTDAKGNKKDPASLPKGEADYYLKHTVPEGMALCFQSKSVDFDIYSGDRLIYSYHPSVPRFYGRGYGKMYHYVLMPASEKGLSGIRIHTISATKDGKSYLKQICFTDPADYIANQLCNNMPNFLICFFIFILGLCLVCGGISLKPDKSGEYIESDQKYRLGILSMGAFALCSSAWSGTETDILQIITRNPSGVHLISYFSLMMLPIPVVMFIAALTDSLDKPVVKLVSYGTLANFVIVISSVMLGGSDYHDLLIITHILLVISIVSDIVLILRGVARKTISRKTAAVIALSFLIVLFSGILEIIRYRFVSNKTDTSSVFRIGMMIFVIILSIYEIRELMRYTKYKEEAFIMERLATTDALTKLNNRTAYNRKISNLQKSVNNSGVIVYLDINDLKRVNDNYGHDEGDRHIKAAAEVIKQAFREEECYRIGGDEFAVVMRTSIHTPDMENRKKALESLCQKYNESVHPPYELHIASGYAVFENGEDLLSAQKTADDMMYENKAKMKAGKGE